MSASKDDNAPKSLPTREAILAEAYKKAPTFVRTSALLPESPTEQPAGSGPLEFSDEVHEWVTLATESDGWKLDACGGMLRTAGIATQQVANTISVRRADFVRALAMLDAERSRLRGQRPSSHNAIVTMAFLGLSTVVLAGGIACTALGLLNRDALFFTVVMPLGVLTLLAFGSWIVRKLA